MVDSDAPYQYFCYNTSNIIAKTLERNEDDEFLVYYIADSSEEWVTGDRISPYEPEMYEIGSSVEVQSEDEEWCPATVKKAWYGLHYISYDDYDDIWDEWVGGDRIRELE